VSDVELHLLQGLGENDVEPTPTIDEYLVESGARHYWIQDERKMPWFGEACPLIRAGEGDGSLRLGSFRLGSFASWLGSARYSNEPAGQHSSARKLARASSFGSRAKL
jgi:hypothetical protein